MNQPASASISGTSQVLKEVAGHFATGVVVVTGIDAGSLVGFTCQSFICLSLDPALVAVCPSRGSTTWQRLRTLDSFCINVLADDQEALSGQFARSGTDKFASVGWRPAPSGSPLLDGVCAWIDVQPWAEYDGGDHTIAVAKVAALGMGASRRPLLFHRSSYGIHRGGLRQALVLEESDEGWDW